MATNLDARTRDRMLALCKAGDHNQFEIDELEKKLGFCFEDKRLYKLVMLGCRLGVSIDTVTLACLLDNKTSPFKAYKNNAVLMLRINEELMKIDNGQMSDHLTLIKIYKSIVENSTSLPCSDWFKTHAINFDVFIDATDKIETILAKLYLLNLRSASSSGDDSSVDQNANDRLVKCCVAFAYIPIAFFSNYAVGETTHPQLFKRVLLPNGRIIKEFYDLSRTVTYAGASSSLISWENHDQRIRQNLAAYHDDLNLNPETIDISVQEKKVNITFPAAGPIYNGFFYPVYYLTRCRQLKISDQNHHLSLFGPKNPLELKFQELLTTPLCRKIKADGTSTCVTVFNPFYHQDIAQDRSRPMLLIGSYLSAMVPDNVITKVNSLYGEMDGESELILLLFGQEVKLFTTKYLTYKDLMVNFLSQHENYDGYTPIGLTGFKITAREPASEMIMPCNFVFSLADLNEILKIRGCLRKLFMISENSQDFVTLRLAISRLFESPRPRIANPIERSILNVPSTFDSNDLYRYTN